MNCEKALHKIKSKENSGNKRQGLEQAGFFGHGKEFEFYSKEK